MSAEYLIVGHFRFVDDTLEAIRKLRADGLNRLELFSPVPNHELEDEIYRNRPRSPVRIVTLLGAITGCLGGFLMTCWMSNDWPLRTSAKTVLSIPAFVVIAFECTILIGGISNILAMLFFSGLPSLKRFPGFRPNFTEGTFGLTVRVPKEAVDSASASMKQCGANSVESQYVR